MTGINRVILSGRVAKSPQRFVRPDGSSVIQFPLELNSKEGLSSKTSPHWIEVVAFGKLGDQEFDHLQTGAPLRVEGELKQRHWQTPEGRHRTRVEVIATDLRRIEEQDDTKRGETDEKAF
jgi:single stranded DNA-binding protein